MITVSLDESGLFERQSNDVCFVAGVVFDDKDQKEEVFHQELIPGKAIQPPIQNRHRFFPSPSQIFKSCINCFFLG